jgi:hypothetical protein
LAQFASWQRQLVSFYLPARAGGKVKTARIGSTWFLPAVGGYYRLRDSLDRLVA